MHLWEALKHPVGVGAIGGQFGLGNPGGLYEEGHNAHNGISIYLAYRKILSKEKKKSLSVIFVLLYMLARAVSLTGCVMRADQIERRLRDFIALRRLIFPFQGFLMAYSPSFI